MSVLSRLRHLAIRKDGATAIEYAIIAGLLGLGIVGSLVTTKTSLNSVFGSAATGVSGDPASSSTANPLAASSPVWSAKTVASRTQGTMSYGAPYTLIRFTDGSTARYQAPYTQKNGSPVPEFVDFVEASKPLRTISTQGAYANNNPYYTLQDNYANGNPQYQYIVQLNPNGMATGTSYTFNSAGSITASSSLSAPNSNFAQAFNDAAYIRSIYAGP